MFSTCHFQPVKKLKVENVKFMDKQEKVSWEVFPGYPQDALSHISSRWRHLESHKLCHFASKGTTEYVLRRTELHVLNAVLNENPSNSIGFTRSYQYTGTHRTATQKLLTARRGTEGSPGLGSCRDFEQCWLWSGVLCLGTYNTDAYMQSNISKFMYEQIS